MYVGPVQTLQLANFNFPRIQQRAVNNLYQNSKVLVNNHKTRVNLQNCLNEKKMQKLHVGFS